MALRNTKTKFTLAVVDRAGLAGEIEAIARLKGVDCDVLSCTSVLEVVGENGPGAVSGLAASASAAGPFLPDLLRWTESLFDQRIPTVIVGSEIDDEAVRMVVGRGHVRWVDQDSSGDTLSHWLMVALEVHQLRSFRRAHDGLATTLRDARLQLFHARISTYVPPEGPPCGPALPTAIEEIQSLKDARAQFERSHIRAAVRECGSLKDASAALGISYTSLWRRLR